MTKQLKKIEAALAYWNEDSNLKRIVFSGAIIHKEVKHVYKNFKKPDDDHRNGGFQAGWFNEFKVRKSHQSIKIVEKAVNY